MSEKKEVPNHVMNVKQVFTLELEKNECIYSLSLPVGKPFKEHIEPVAILLQGVSELSSREEESKKKKETEDGSSDEDKDKKEQN